MATIKAAALITDNTSGILRAGEIERRAPGEHDVLMKVMFCGICHSDLHQIRGEWPQTVYYPMVPGHEIVGVVEQVGSKVSKWQVGDRIGVGCFVDSCRKCEACSAGEEQYCTGNPDDKDKCHISYNCCLKDEKNIHIRNSEHGELLHGGYSTLLTVDENYAVRIPDNIPLEQAAPLLCAGITTYSPLMFYGRVVQATTGKTTLRVGVAGLGGLGHMAVQLGKKMGHHVTVLSRSERKRQAALDMGADAFVNMSNASEAKAAGKTLDLIVDTISADHDVNELLGLLHYNGVMCLVGIPPNPMPIGAFDIIASRKLLVGSMIGGIRETQEVLDFCSKHNVFPHVECIDAKEVNRKLFLLSRNSASASRYVLRIAETLTPTTVVEEEPQINPADWHVNPKATIVPASANIHAK